MATMEKHVVKKLGIEMSESLHSQTKALAASLRITLKRATHEAFSNWVALKTAPPAGTTKHWDWGPPTPEEKDLRTILQTGSKAEKEFVAYLLHVTAAGIKGSKDR
jgi:hypothetical protein